MKCCSKACCRELLQFFNRLPVDNETFFFYAEIETKSHFQEKTLKIVSVFVYIAAQQFWTFWALKFQPRINRFN